MCLLVRPVIKYQEPAPAADTGDFSSTLSSTLPMAAIFMRNRYVGWAALVYSIQSWLGESEDSKKNSSTPGYFSVGMSRKCWALPLFAGLAHERHSG
jgi:hypothetical protein